VTETSTSAIVLYGKPGCGLCEETRDLLRAILDRRAAEGLPSPTIVERDILTDQALHDAFGSTIPVVEVGGRRLELAIGGGTLRRFLADVLDSGTNPDARGGVVAEASR
jgi:hypothetical protein